MPIDREAVKIALIARGYEVVELAMQSQVRYQGRLFGGFNTNHAYLVSGPVKETGVVDRVTALPSFVKRSQPWRFWWQTPDIADFYVGLELVRSNLT